MVFYVYLKHEGHCVAFRNTMFFSYSTDRMFQKMIKATKHTAQEVKCFLLAK